MRVAVGGGVFVELGRVAVQAAGLGSVSERAQVGGVGVGGGRGPEVDGRDHVGAMVAAVLLKVVGQPVQRALPGPGGMLGRGAAAAVALVAWSSSLDGGEHAGDAVAGFCDVVQSLFKPVVTTLVPLGFGESAVGGLVHHRGQPVVVLARNLLIVSE
ncbi:hypothetical protein GCM10010329_79640 [Streptomyces spiroverticillatus]|uniref:Uncharacterized protein n=1 Tax=Streptomyces finlayi TaxID=67296 RepID=A0A919CFL4_9ACTN|nr:hypothetical protein [Streptomyces finlayi]GHA44980.1 hypothetical protein GCM10010329_79640 [Streptomyces spiroverticillatus]GHD18141.1 hypothetical protein GCM10010334_80620 [Streptomyces finlayi]